MPLPKISTPTYELMLPSNNETIKYRPFLVKEEKLLLIALQSQDQKQITNAIKTVIKDCILTKNVKVDSLPTFDIEWIFLNVRGKSIGEKMDVNLICPDDGETTVKKSIFIDDIKVWMDDEHEKTIDLGDELKMDLKYPSLDEFVKNNFDVGEDNSVEQSFDLIAACIDKVYNEEEVWVGTDFSKKELKEFVDQLTTDQFKKVEKFFETMPKLSYETQVKNPKTGVESTIKLEGLASFFA